MNVNRRGGGGIGNKQWYNGIRKMVSKDKEHVEEEGKEKIK